MIESTRAETSQQTVSRKLIIVGGGIGGLSAAIALDRAGEDVSVYERSPVFAEVGAGMSLWPNATRILKSWDLLHAVISLGEPVTHFDLLRHDGRTLSQIPFDRTDTPAICIHRANLHQVLRQALRPERLNSSQTLSSFSQGRNGRVTAQFSGGLEVEADGLVGADGVNSVVRSQLHGSHPPIYRGYTIWRGIAVGVDPGPKGHISETWGRGQRFGIMPLGQGRVCWYATHNSAAERPDGPAGRKREVQELFRGWHNPVQELIEATENGLIMKNDARDRKPLQHWGEGKVTLLGDAAHPITPNIGQGACMAIEDAACLAKNLRHESDVATAFSCYELARSPRTAFVAVRSRRIGTIGQMENRAMVRARNRIAQFVLMASRGAAFSSVYAYEV